MGGATIPVWPLEASCRVLPTPTCFETEEVTTGRHDDIIPLQNLWSRSHLSLPLSFSLSYLSLFLLHLSPLSFFLAALCSCFALSCESQGFCCITNNGPLSWAGKGSVWVADPFIMRKRERGRDKRNEREDMCHNSSPPDGCVLPPPTSSQSRLCSPPVIMGMILSCPRVQALTVAGRAHIRTVH